MMSFIETVDVDPTTLMVVTGIAIPFLVSALTKLHAPSKLKATINMVLLAISTFLANSVTDQGHAVFSLSSVKDWAMGLVVSIGVYYGVLKPFGGNEALWPDKGLGASVAPAAPEVAPTRGE